MWNHVAVVRNGTTFRLYVNGVADATTYNIGTQAIDYYGAYNKQPSIAARAGYGTAGAFNAYISDFRTVIGSAVYTSNFVPPLAPLTLIVGTKFLSNFTNGGIIDYHATNNLETTGTTQLGSEDPYAVNYYSNFFAGTSSDYLTIAASGAGTLLDHTGDFTTELWIYWAVMPPAGYDNIYGNNGVNGTYVLGTSNTSTVWSAPYVLRLYVTGVGAVIDGNTVLTAGQWYHIAHTRTSNVNRLFVNGVVQTNTYTDATSRAFGSAGTTIARNSNAYVSNFRYVKGTSLYNTTFTPSTTSLSAISGTSALTCQSNSFKDNSTNNFTITRNGTTSVKSFNPFQLNIGKSLYFGTKTDTYSIRSIPSIATLAGDFTIECWVNPTDITLSTTWGILDARAAGASASAWLICLSSYSSGWVMNMYIGTSYSGTTRVQANQWTHCAWVRSGSTLTFYVNGVAGGTATVSGVITGGTTTMVLGSKDNGLTGYGTVGYIKDLRITNGFARTITVPNAPLGIK